MSKSIQGYIWFPSSCTWLSEYLTVQLGESYSLNDIVLMPAIVLLITVFGIILCIWKWDNIFASLLPLVCGLAGIWGYLSKPAFQLGNNWGVHLAICIVMMFASVIKIYFLAKRE